MRSVSFLSSLTLFASLTYLHAQAPATPPPPSVTPITGQKAAVQAIPFNTPSAALLASRKESYSVTVTSTNWLDTKVPLVPGDQITFTAAGSAPLSDGRTASPAGLARGWKDMLRSFPAQAGDVGALVGRIGSEEATVPFALGASKQLTVAAAGGLYLRINTSSDLTTTGTYAVTIKISKHATAAPSTPAPDLTSLVQPAFFDKIPRRVQDQAGNPGDMVNFAIVGSADQVARAFTEAGWIAVDKNDQAAVLHGLVATLQHRAYTGVPVSTLYLFDRPQDLSFERAAPFAVAAIRHHLRVWKTTETLQGRPVWVGSATHDNGFEKDQRNGNITHHVDPKIDVERDFIEQSFAAAGVLSAAAYVTPANPFLAAKTATGGDIMSDGRIVFMDLRSGLQ